MEQLYNTLDAFFAPGILIGFAVCFFFLYIPPKAALRNYRRARYVMGIAYLFYALCIYLEHNLFSDVENTALASPIILFVACFQAFLFTHTLINLISLNYVKLSKLTLELIIIVAVAGTFFALYLGYPDAISFWGFVIFYIALLVRYVILFNKQYSHYTSLMDNFFSDEESRRLQWVKRSFYISLAVGVLALIYAMVPTASVGLVFITVVIAFYAAFGVRFINYALLFHSIETAITTSDDSFDNNHEPDNEMMQRINELMLNEKLYRKSDLSVNDIAQWLGERPRIISGVIKTCQQTNFKTYINGFRVQEAKRLIDDDKNNSRTIDAIASEAGFSNRSSFYRVFKRLQGISPTDYRLGTN